MDVTAGSVPMLEENPAARNQGSEFPMNPAIAGLPVATEGIKAGYSFPVYSLMREELAKYSAKYQSAGGREP